MPIKDWCVSTSHPIVQQVAKKYNIPVADARSIYNVARENDIELQNDNVTMAFLDQRDAFKDALSAYTQKYVEADKYLLGRVKGDGRTTKDIHDEIREELGDDVSEEEIENMQNRIQELPRHIRRSQLSTRSIVRILNGFEDTRRLDFLGNWICRYMSDTMSYIELNADYRRENDIPTKNRRQDYYTDQFVADTVKVSAKDALQEAKDLCEEQGNATLARELQTVIDNYDTVLFMYGGLFFRNEGVSINMNGDMKVSASDSASLDRNDVDTREDDEESDDVDMEEQPTSGFSSSDQNKSVSTKIQGPIKTLLSNIKRVDRKGDYITDPYGFNLVSYISVPLATNKLLSVCKGCETFSEMMQAMKRAQRSTPWLEQLTAALDTEDEYDVSGELKVSSSKKEQLQSQFFQSFRKQFTKYRHSYIQYDGSGRMYTVNADSNVNHRSERMMHKIQRNYAKFSGAKIFSGGIVDFKAVDDIFKALEIHAGRVQRGNKSVEGLLNDARIAAATAANDGALSGTKGDFTEANRILGDAEKTLRTALNDLGIDVSETLMGDYASVGDAKEASESLYGNDVTFGDENLALRFSNLQKLRRATVSLVRELQEWKRAQDAGETTDNPRTNIFDRRRDSRSNYAGIFRLRNKFTNIVEMLASSSPDSFESFAHINGKDYYSWNNPSSIGTIVEKLTQSSRDRVRDYIEKRYGKDKMWFVNPDSNGKRGEMHFYSDWLDEIYNGNGKDIFDYSEKPMFCGKDYNELSDASYALSILQDYFGNMGLDKQTAWYRMLIASDKPRYSSIKYKKYTDNGLNQDGSWTEDNYHNVISRKAIDFFAQEIRRANEVIHHATTNDWDIDVYDPKMEGKALDVIEKVKNKKRVTREDVLENGRYIFRNSGASFYFNKFINDEIENPNSTLGAYVIDKVFNSGLSGKEERVIEDNIVKPFKTAFHQYIGKIKDSYIKKLDESGMLELAENKVTDQNTGKTIKTYYAKYLLGSLLQWHSDDPNFTTIMYGREDEMMEMAAKYGVDVEQDKRLENYFYQLVQFDKDIEEFVYNNWLAKVNMAQIFDVDLAFYGNTTNFQKRNAQIISSGYVTDPEARIHGQLVSDGKYRSITIKTDKKNISQHIENIEVALRKAADTIQDQKQRQRFLDSAKDTIDQLNGFDATDGQAFTSLTALRKRLAGQGEWSRSDTSEMDDDPNVYTDEAVYRRMKKGTATTEDLMHVFAQAQKPFVYAFVDSERKGRGTITTPVQHKNSEYALAFLSAFTGAEPKSQVDAIAKFMEETAKDDSTYGIDTANFDSGVKIGGNSRVIDISGLTPQKALEKLRQAAYGKKPTLDEKGRKVYKQGAVTEYENTDYKIQQQKNEHFKHNAQPLGSQIKILAINNIADTADVTLPSGKVIKGKEMKRRYFDALKRKMRGVEAQFREDLGLNLPHKKRLHKLSNTLKAAMSTDQKFGVEMRHALSIVERNGEEQFAIPLDEPGMQSAVEAMLYSKIRRTYYKQKTNGGIVVQATSWGASEDLGIRFYSSNPEDKDGLVPTKKEFAAKNKLKPGEELNARYKEYLEQYQTGYAYFEAEVPMPDYVKDMLRGVDGKVDPKYMNADGTWNMDAIKEVVPASAFDAICYRVPTEAKYSIMLCKIVRFSPEASGSVAKYPQELTVFTGSDFDIDTDTIELRPIAGSESEAEDNELFDLQMAALRSSQGLLETFKPGDFSDLSEMSYYMTLLASGQYTKEQLEGKSRKELKKLCEQVEDLDLMNPETDIILHNQNADAGDMIAIAAVGVTSHAFLSLYNDIDVNDPQRNPELHPENFIRIKFRTPSKGSNNQTFTVVNDKNADDVTEKYIGGNDVILDAVYDMDGKLIGTEISKYVGGSADAAKDAALYRLNITTKTLPILILMHRLGISSDVARAFIAQPVIRRAVAKLNAASSFGYSSFANACDEVREEIMMENFGGNPQAFTAALDEAKTRTDITLRYSELRDNIEHPEKQSASDKLNQLHILEVLSTKSAKVKNLDSFSRYNSSAAMRWSSFLDRYATRMKIQKLKENLEPESEDSVPEIRLPENIEIMDGFPPTNFGKLCSMFPYIGQTVIGETQLTEDIILENMKTYSPSFFSAVKRLGIEDDAAAMKALYAGWKNYLLFVGPNRIADFWNENTAKYYTKDFSEHFYDVMDELEKDKDFYREVIEGNTFLDSIHPIQAKEGYDNFFMLGTDVIKQQEGEAEKYKKDWERLLHYPQTRKLATDLAIHFLARSSAFSKDTPVHLIPIAIQEAIPNYVEAFARAQKVTMSETDMMQFLAGFCLNNSDNRKIVPHLRSKANEPSIVFAPASEDNPESSLYFTKKELPSKWLMNDGQRLTFRTPVLHITNSEFPNGQLFITTGEISLEEVEGETVVSVPAIPVSPLGIPYQMSEYTGLDMSSSIFKSDGQVTASDADASEVTPFEDPFFDGDEMIEVGRRTGSFLEDSPYGDVTGDVEKYLSETSYDKSAVEGEEVKQSAYLESRTFLRRAEKLAGIVGLTLDSSQRGYTGTTPTYMISVSPTKYGMDQHESAVEAAALISSLANVRKGKTSVKTYVNNPNSQFNKIELSIRLAENAKEEGARDFILNWAQRLSIPYFWNTDTNELQFTLNAEFDEDVDAFGIIRQGTDDVKKFVSVLQSRGYTDTSTIEANYIYEEELTDDSIEETLNNIKDEAEDREQRDAEKNQAVNRGNGRNQNWEPVRLSYIADLALRKKNGEKVNNEIHTVFGERSGLRNPTASFESGEVLDQVVGAMDTDVYSAMKHILLDYRTDNLTETDMFDRLILNTANWIISNRPQDNLVTMMGNLGADESTSRSIISTIDQILEDLDIC